MNAAKKLREVVRFEPDKPVQVSFDYNVGTAKSSTRETDYGPKTSYTVSVNKNQVMFASEALFAKIRDYQQGESAIITLVDGRTWSINSAGERKVAKISGSINDSESIALLKSIDQKLDKLLNGEDKKKQDSPKKEDELGF